jgi:hypothetical protein
VKQERLEKVLVGIVFAVLAGVQLTWPDRVHWIGYGWIVLSLLWFWMAWKVGR